MTVNSQNAGSITVNDVAYELEAGVDKVIEVTATNFKIILGVWPDNTHNIQGDITFSNMVIE